MAAWTRAKVFVTARTYPTPAYKGVEVSCTGGVSADGKWMRLFPVPYRFLSPDRRFQKYQWIEVNVTKASDPRPESYNLDIDSIRILSGPLPTTNHWRDRKAILSTLTAPSLCHLIALRDANRFPTLGLFRPASITTLRIESDTPNWSEAELARLRQIDLFNKAPATELEKIPYKFKYRFTCDDTACKGHELMCADWEMGQSYRSWRGKYGTKWEEKFRQRYQDDMINRLDTHFHVGTVHGHPNRWIIVGLFYPPREPVAVERQLSLL